MGGGEGRPAKRGKPLDGGAGSGAGVAPPVFQGSPVPSQTLLLQNLPESVDEDMLKTLFWQFAGFVNVTLPPGGLGVAFVEFADVSQASVAHRSMQKFELQGSQLLVSFANSA